MEQIYQEGQEIWLSFTALEQLLELKQDSIKSIVVSSDAQRLYISTIENKMSCDHKWEYTVLCIGTRQAPFNMHEELNKMGEEGWEAWNVDFSVPDMVIVQMKRKYE